MRIIIICAGEGKRWGNYLGVKKHLITIDGKRLLDRTVEQFQNEDIFIVANSTDYQVEGAKLYSPDYNQSNAGADKLANSSCLWSDSERTILLFGDVYFTDQAIQIIKRYNKRDWAVFGRMHASDITGCQWGELFAFSFYPEHIKELHSAIETAVSYFKNGTINRCQGWEVYRAWAGVDIKAHTSDEHFIEINDFTDDFDYSHDYDVWMQKRSNTTDHKATT